MYTALLMHLSVIIFALSVESIDAVFDFAGAIGSSATMFLFPGIAYIVSLKRFGTIRQKKKWETTFYQIFAWVFLVIEVIVLALFFWLKIAHRTGKTTDED